MIRASASVFLFVALTAFFCQAKTRHYYIAAEDVTWDYAPGGMDLLRDRGIPQPWAHQTKWNKTRYIEYTDATFTVRKPQPEWLGILGPIIRAEVGDTILVDFMNRSNKPHTMHPHGVHYDKANEGAFYLPVGGPGALVPPGARFTYRWLADASSGPGPGAPSSIVWWYHSHIDTTEINDGLLGPIIITAKGKANPDGSPKDVDREFIALYMIFDQLNGKDAGLFHSINGYIFGNLPGLVMKQGDRVRWYLLGMGNERDVHTPHWHGETVVHGTQHTDVIELLPGSMVTVDMLADNPGTWMFHCHVADHMEAGMIATYTIYQPQSCSSPVQFLSGEFWNTDKYRVNIKDAGTKEIKSLRVTFDYLLSDRSRTRPFNHEWMWQAKISPGEQHMFEVPAGISPQLENNVDGWVLYPQEITYKDGSQWKPKREGECFKVFWRDKGHLTLETLPPLQLDVGKQD